MARVLYADPRVLADAELERQARTHVPAEDLVAIDRFKIVGRRYEAIATRVITRWALGALLGRAPSELRFELGPHGKPRLAGDGRLPSFNVSNTNGMVVCAVGDGELGVDVEGATSSPRIAEVAELVFREEERVEIAALGEAARRRDLVERWTLKEAYVKARGLGFSLPPHTFSVFTAKPRLRFVEDGDPVAGWSLRVDWIDDHAVALCERNATEPEIERVDLAALVASPRVASR